MAGMITLYHLCYDLPFPHNHNLRKNSFVLGDTILKAIEIE